jgi:hypothetical protein
MAWQAQHRRRKRDACRTGWPRSGGLAPSPILPLYQHPRSRPSSIMACLTTKRGPHVNSPRDRNPIPFKEALQRMLAAPPAPRKATKKKAKRRAK